MEPEEPKESTKRFDLSDLPPRPKPVNGDYGREVMFLTNYYKMKFREKDQMFYQSEMTFEPPIEQNARKKIRAIIQALKPDMT